jgi:hypothetical protein
MCAQGTLSSTIVLQAGGVFKFFYEFQQAKMSPASKIVGISKHTHAGSLFHGYLQEKPQGTTIKDLSGVMSCNALQARHPQNRAPLAPPQAGHYFVNTSLMCPPDMLIHVHKFPLKSLLTCIKYLEMVHVVGSTGSKCFFPRCLCTRLKPVL